ncbi:MAG TPA: 2-methylcitrate dehydratase [Rhodospirillaceae bacterium]|nr:2-methylcitrate dehydratase [Rhodospirillaceae bacterium]
MRELDFHDSFFGADVAHTGDTMSGVLAVAQQLGCDGAALLKGILTAYETQIALAHNIPLAASKLDHPAHIVPAVVCGIGAMLGLEADVIHQAVQHGVQVSAVTGQARRGEITSWKANAPGHSSMLAIHAVDRAMRGERSPGPIYEGDFGFLAAYVNEAPDGYDVMLPEAGEPKRRILETYTKEHAAGYHGQVPIDLAFKMRDQLDKLDEIESIVLKTKYKTHMMMGAGAGDDAKWDPNASRETLDHSAMYCFAVALEDGTWHHEKSYAPERAQRPETVTLWQKVTTVEDPEWTERYNDRAPLEKDHGMRAVVTYKDGTVIEDEMAVPNAHPRGARPFGPAEYEQKFRTLTDGIVESPETDRFIVEAGRLQDLTADELRTLLPTVPDGTLTNAVRDDKGIF